MTHDEALAKFAALCRAHDATYAFSDDFSCYKQGDAERKEIEQFAREHLPWAEASAIFLEACGEYAGSIPQY